MESKLKNSLGVKKIKQNLLLVDFKVILLFLFAYLSILQAYKV